MDSRYIGLTQLSNSGMIITTVIYLVIESLVIDELSKNIES